MTKGDDIEQAKEAQRARAKAARTEAFNRHGSEAASKLAKFGLTAVGVAAGARVAGYFAIGSEIDPAPLMSRLQNSGHQLCLPVVQAKEEPLVFRAWQPGDALEVSCFKTRVPVADAPVVEPDVLLVPLLAFDTCGYRLGYGGGFYDRTLAHLRVKKTIKSIGIAFDEQRLDEVCHLDYDQPLDWVLTPSGLLDCRGC